MYLLKRFQEFSEHKQVQTDKNCYYLAYEMCKVEMLLSYYLPAITAVASALLTGDMFLLIISGMLLMMSVMGQSRLEMIRYISRQTKKVPEPPSAMRCYLLAMVPVITLLQCGLAFIFLEDLLFASIFVLCWLGWFALVSMYYFLSCTPLPPETLEFRRNTKRSARKARALRPQTT